MKFKILFTLLLFIPLHLLTANQTELLDKVYAVHATRTLPEKSYLRAGFGRDGLSAVQKALIPQVRQTLHFSLGELVRPVEGFMSWEDCPYAIVTRLRTLLPQLINVNCYDTFILGDLKLGSDTYLILPVEMAINLESEAVIITYDPQNKTLRETVDELICSEEGWHIEMNNDDIEDELHEAYLDGRNVNTAAFFEPLTKESPWLAVGLRFEPLDGEHYRLSQIEQPVLFTSQQFFNDQGSLESSYFENTLLLVNDHFEQWSQSLAGFNWNRESLSAYDKLTFELKKWVCLIEEELRLRKVHGKTLKMAPDDLLQECGEFLSRPEALQNYFDQHRDRLLNFF